MAALGLCALGLLPEVCAAADVRVVAMVAGLAGAWAVVPRASA